MRKIAMFFVSSLCISVVLISCNSVGKSDSTSALGSTEKNAVLEIKKFSVDDFVPGKTFEFHAHSIVAECTDPTIRKVTVLDNQTVKIYVWHKGCPNNRVEEDELIYSYKIEESSKWRHEYEWLKTDDKVVILENKSAGYYGGHMYLSKRYMITNAYNKERFLETRLFQQLDIEEYPSRNGVFSSEGGMVTK